LEDYVVSDAIMAITSLMKKHIITVVIYLGLLFIFIAADRRCATDISSQTAEAYELLQTQL
jgi:hypothetical protein